MSIQEHHPPTNRTATSPLSALQDMGPSAARVDASILEICDYLEAENAKLESLLLSSNAELNQLRTESSTSKIIPHYRLALTRLRNQCVEITKKLLTEQVS